MKNITLYPNPACIENRKLTVDIISSSDQIDSVVKMIFISMKLS